MATKKSGKAVVEGLETCLCCGEQLPANEMSVRLDWQSTATIVGEEDKGDQLCEEKICFCSPDCLDTVATADAVSHVKTHGTHDGIPVGYTCVRILQHLNDTVERITSNADRGLLPVHRIVMHFPRSAMRPSRAKRLKN